MKFLKKFLVIILILATVLTVAFPAEASQKTNWQITKELCKKSGYSKIKVVNANKLIDKQFWKILDHRKGKSYIVVEKVVSVSDGTGYGWYSTGTKGTNYIIGYNKKVKKGKKVTSYVIWNPKTNICDDILYVVDNYKYRK